MNYSVRNDLIKFYRKYFGKKDTKTAYDIILEGNEEILITFLLSSYNCYVIKRNHSYEGVMSMILNPERLLQDYEIDPQFLEEFKSFIVSRVEESLYENKEENNNK